MAPRWPRTFWGQHLDLHLLPYLLLPLNVFVAWILISASPMPPLRMVTDHHRGTLPRRHVYLQHVTTDSPS